MKKYFTRIISFLVGMAFLSVPNYSSAQCGAGETSHSYCYTFGEVNTVAFEVCPTAGMIAEADITQGTFDLFFPNGLTVYQGASGSGTTGTNVFSQTGGDVSGNTVTSTIADECLIFVINTLGVPGFACADGGGFLAVEACGRSLPATTVNFIAPGPFCANAGVQTGLGGGTPTGGVYSGNGVTDAGNGTNFSFDPAGVGVVVGNNSVTYTNGGSASDNIVVIASPSFTAPVDLCVNVAPVPLTGGSPAGGTYSGDGVVGNTFNPGLAGIGTHTLTYTTSCGMVTDNVEVLDCGCPVGGGFTTYFYCYDNFESNTVAFEVCPSAGMAAKATITQGTIEDIMGSSDQLRVFEGTSGSGTAGTLVFGPDNGNLMGEEISGSGANNCLIFVIDSDNIFSCADGDQTGLQACGEDIAPATVVNFVATPNKVCLNGGTQVIGGGSPTGGAYSGNGVTDDGNGTTFTFNPMGAGVVVGNNTVTYTNGASATSTVMVVNVTAAMASPGVTFCPSDGPQLLSGLGTPSGFGGVYSGTGVTNLGDGVNFLFDPNGLSGMYPITYTFTDANGCVGSASTNFEVAFPSVTFTAPPDLCLDAGVQTNLGGGLPVGGVYSGDGVTDGGNGTDYSFDPDAMATGVGVHTITYTYTSISGCSASAMDGIEVFALPNVTFTAPADLCLDAGVQTGLSGGLPAGGMYSGDGVNDDGNGSTYSFDPSMGGAGVGVHTITYEFTDANGCTNSDSDDVEVFAIPAVTFTASPTNFCENGGMQTGLGGGLPTGGMYSGTGVMDDGNGSTYTFNPAATVGGGSVDITYSYTANGCTGMAEDDVLVVPPPTVAFTAPADLCITAGLQAGLGDGTPPEGTEGGDIGMYSGDGVIDDGNGMTYSFDPPVAGVGIHTLTYTYTDGNGCMNSASDDIEVFGPPTITCPGDITEPNDAGQCNADITVTAPTVSGGCFGTTVINDYNGTADASDNYPVGPTTVTFTVTDGSGNSATCSMTVTVEDTEDPSLSCPGDISENINPGTCEATFTVPTPTDTDNCAVTVLRYRYREVDDMGSHITPSWSSWSTAPMLTLDAGFWKIQWQAKDAAGNQDKCSFLVDIIDNEPPTPVCLDPLIEFNGEDEISLTAADVYDDINSTDNCGTVIFISATPSSVTCDQLGNIVPVTVVVEDAAGNPAQCTANVEVGGFPCGWSFDDDGINCTDGSSASFDPGTETFSLTSETCFDPAFYSTTDLHGYIGNELCGDGEIIAEITDVIGNGWAGITMRETLLSGSKMIQLMIDGSFLTMRELRQSTGGYAYAHQFVTNGKNWLRLTRSGNLFGAYHSTDGVNWEPVLITQIMMPGCINIGLVTANKAPSGTVTGTFDNVEIIESVVPLSTPSPQDEAELNVTYQPEVSIYPNPSTGETFVDLNGYLGQKTNIRIFNSAGQLLDTLEVDEVQVPTQRLELSRYQNGLYLIQIQAEGFETVTKKLTLIK